MTKIQLILLRNCSPELKRAIETTGPIECISDPHVVLSQVPQMIPGTGSVPLSGDSLNEVERSLALSCTYEEATTEDCETVRHQLKLVAIALQLVKPTVSFLELWLKLATGNLTEAVNRPVSDLGRSGPWNISPYLEYQQSNRITESDVQRAVGLLPRLSRSQEKGHGSWNHPLLPIHRAVIFFCQGYSVRPSVLNQFLWAAGLDSLYTSKLNKRKQNSAEMSRRMQALLGSTLRLYEADTVSIPIHQLGRTRKELLLVAPEIFRLRNAFAHGLRIPDDWLSGPGQRPESGYAYQLVEQTEIALRLTLLRILEDQTLFDTFSDPHRLDSYF